ncbi:hypothetical protein CYLTODRAFT_495084 [Cylindrobasidium torrendii FP15055 ss-10]|uniref:ferric-chelate reductase (NADPH) n=1 Tax=Cylindrobasidium torrendii FP15055 ss-10 TaxID=1314674 RepID=A0A0D7AU68_9AGAR|nr:hypothetical protein CYLTODRAFT_495084 [Cylindrobasidium torrendii FP15055 ss-10]
MAGIQAPNPNPTTPVYTNDLQWITAYLTVHMMSDNSRRYAYLFWLCLAAVLVVCIAIRLSGLNGTVLGAYWKRWSIRRRTWRGYYPFQPSINGKRAPVSLPPNGQLLTLFLIPVVAIILCFAGSDYIAPSSHIFDLTNPGTVVRRTSYDVAAFVKWQPQYTIRKAWWTMGGRAGLIAFALLPLVVLLGLKAAPFALFSWTLNLHFDKLSWLHRWIGRLVYLVTLLHVIFWCIQLGTDKRPHTDGEVAFRVAWLYPKFIAAWIAFFLLTMMMILSLSPIRKHHYETFYAFHVVLVPGFIVAAAFHHPPVWIWCWVALALWVGERCWRGVWWLHNNGMFGHDVSRAAASIITTSHQHQETLPEQKKLQPGEYESPGVYPPPSPYLSRSFSQRSRTDKVQAASSVNYCPPSGYSHAELLSGATIRLTFISPRHFSWAPGQHFLVNIPSVSAVLSHPFTAASICDEQSPSEAGRVLTFLIRSRSGWTRDLWDYVLALSNRGQNHAPGEIPPNGTIMPKNGVLLRTFIDGPFGSAAGARWEQHATVVLFVAGSGVSFGLSVLEYVCLCLAGRDGKYLGGRPGGWGKKGFRTRRVRFVWIIREFAHIQWCAATVRRCMEMIPSPGLEVSIYVTNAKPDNRMSRAPRMSRFIQPSEVSLVPPQAAFMAGSAMPPIKPSSSRSSSRPTSPDSGFSSDSDHDEMDTGYYAGEFGDEDDITTAHEQRENYMLDLTNFDGDNDFALPGEAFLSQRLSRIGMDRRKHARRFSKSVGLKESITADELGRQSRMSVQSTEGLLSDTWRPGSKRFSMMSMDTIADASEEGGLGIGGYNEQTDRVERPATPELDPRTAMRPPSGSFSPRPNVRIQVPTSPTSPRPISPALSEVTTIAPPAEYSGGTALVMEDGTKVHGLHLSRKDMKDISVVAEHARAGRPKLEKILKDEVDSANGSVIVGSCGPSSYSAMVRRAVAMQIDPQRLRKGDRRGHVDLVSEEFEY